VPQVTEAEVTLPVTHFERPVIILNGKTAKPKIHVSSGKYHFEVTGNFKQ
jgi:hypothetical protein